MDRVRSSLMREGSRTTLARRAMRLFAAVLFASATAAAVEQTGVAARPVSCERLSSLALGNGSVTHVEIVAAGAFQPPTTSRGGPPPSGFDALPAFCRLSANLKPSTDSDINIEVWMPIDGWNGKFEAVGNGGWGGSIAYGGLSTALRRGYATASTDMGHQGARGDFALGHPEKLTDFAHRATHELSVQAKSIIQAFYGRSPTFSYFEGCSGGGRQALKEAQKYPNDFDGIVAGAPANHWTHLSAQLLWAAQATRVDPASMISREKLPMIHTAVLSACDRIDGVADGVLEDPTKCRFDPAALLCQSGDGPSCLTAPQVKAVRQIYSEVKNPRTGQTVAPGLERGSEARWASWAIDPAPILDVMADHFKYVVFKDPRWNFRTLNLDADVALADKLDDGLINATDPNLKPFTAHGGRLIMFQGWGDHLVPPTNIVTYYNGVVASLGQVRATEAVRLFMVPGMGHCSSGDGPTLRPNAPELVTALEDWVERRKAPQQIVVQRVNNGAIDRTRPLCPYPQVARYRGTGSTDDAASFTCAASQRF
jgi:feruloyl esterase